LLLSKSIRNEIIKPPISLLYRAKDGAIVIISS